MEGGTSSRGGRCCLRGSIIRLFAHEVLIIFHESRTRTLAKQLWGPTEGILLKGELVWGLGDTLWPGLKALAVFQLWILRFRADLAIVIEGELRKNRMLVVVVILLLFVSFYFCWLFSLTWIHPKQVSFLIQPSKPTSSYFTNTLPIFSIVIDYLVSITNHISKGSFFPILGISAQFLNFGGI